MKVKKIPANSGTTERRCHCGARFKGADHCPYCMCEKYERYCDATYPDYKGTESWMPGQRHAGYDA